MQFIQYTILMIQGCFKRYGGPGEYENVCQNRGGWPRPRPLEFYDHHHEPCRWVVSSEFICLIRYYFEHSGKAEEGIPRTRGQDWEYPTRDSLKRTRTATMVDMEAVAVADGKNAAPSNISWIRWSTRFAPKEDVVENVVIWQINRYQEASNKVLQVVEKYVSPI